MRVEIPIVGSYGETLPIQFDPQTTLNMYEDVNEDNSLTALIKTPGYSLEDGLSITGSGGVRKLYTSKLTKYMQAVIGENAYSIDSALNYIFGQKLTTSSGYIGIDEVVSQIMFVDGSKGYIIDKSTNSYNEIVDPDFPPLPIDIAAFGDRFFVIDGETSDVYFSDSNDGTKWNTLNKFSITTYPDIAVAIKPLDGRLFVFGTRCVEVWVLQGGAFPVARDEASLIEYGCAGAGTVASENGVMIWLGYDRKGVTSVVATKGGVPERISSTDLERIFQDYEDVSDATAFMYWQDGILFYQLNFTKENSSFLFNLKTKKWSILSYKDSDRHRGQTLTHFNGDKFIGDYESPNIYKFGDKYNTDNGISIKRKRVTTVLYPNKGRPFVCRSLRFVIEQGVGKENGKDEEPKLLIRLSRDNGATFSNQMWLPIGRLGDTNQVTEIYRLGYFKYGSLVLEIEFYNFCKFSVFKCFAELDG